MDVNNNYNLDGICEGSYIELFTYDADYFNQLLMQGYSVTQAREMDKEKNRNILGLSLPGSCVYMVYEYEINGYKYVRADEKPCYRRDTYIAIHQKQKYKYYVRYMTQNPAIAQIGGAILPNGTEGSTESNPFATAALILGICSIVLSGFVFPGIVTGILGLVFGIMAAAINKDKAKMKTAAIICSCVGIVISIIVVLVMMALFILTAGLQGTGSFYYSY